MGTSQENSRVAINYPRGGCTSFFPSLSRSSGWRRYYERRDNNYEDSGRKKGFVRDGRVLDVKERERNVLSQDGNSNCAFVRNNSTDALSALSSRRLDLQL